MLLKEGKSMLFAVERELSKDALSRHSYLIPT